jgi:hypothetical protein
MIEKLLTAWCRQMHDGAMWPMHGRYLCRQCLREYRLAWEDSSATETAGSAQRVVSAASASMDACA